ncbi:MAG: transporter substrate-binding domain-containing protein [Candidatus Nanopelagicales bacterium]
MVSRNGASTSLDGGVRVGVGKGYAVESFVRERYPDVDWVAEPNDVASLKAVDDGSLDAAVMDLATFSYYGPKQSLRLGAGSEIPFDYPLSFAIRRDRPDIAESLSDGVRTLPADRRSAIVSKWMPTFAPKGEDGPHRWLIFAVGVAVVGLLLIGLGVWKGRRAHAP